MRLAIIYPHTLALFDDSEYRESQSDNITEKEDLDRDVLLLAQSTHADILLPVVLYECVTRSLDEIFDRFHSHEEPERRLPDQDLRACIVNREFLTAARADIAFKFITEHTTFAGAACLNATECTEWKLIFLSSYNWKWINRCPRALDTLEETVGLKGLNGLCLPCTKAFKIFFEVGRQRVWNMLPSIFDLPEWDTLMKSL